MATKTVTVERYYSVTFTDPNLGLKVALNVLVLPASSNPELRDWVTPGEPRRPQSTYLGPRLGVDNFSANYDGSQISNVLERLLERAMDLEHDVARETKKPLIADFVCEIVNEPFVPVEASPLSGESLSRLAKDSSLLGFASIGESFALFHHDPVVLIVTPFCVVVIGATVGIAEGLRERLRTWLVGTRIRPDDSMLTDAARRARRKDLGSLDTSGLDEESES
jgi:hypothetical protein